MMFLKPAWDGSGMESGRTGPLGGKLDEGQVLKNGSGCNDRRLLQSFAQPERIALAPPLMSSRDKLALRPRDQQLPDRVKRIVPFNKDGARTDRPPLPNSLQGGGKGEGKCGLSAGPWQLTTLIDEEHPYARLAFPLQMFAAAHAQLAKGEQEMSRAGRLEDLTRGGCGRVHRRYCLQANLNAAKACSSA